MLQGDLRQFNDAFRTRFHQRTSDSITVRFAPRYAEATFAVICAVFLTVPPLVAGLAHLPEAKNPLTEFGLSGAIISLAIMAVLFTIFLFCTFWLLHCIFPRLFVFTPNEISFKGVPGTGFDVPASNIKSIQLVTYRHRNYWICHVSLELRIGGTHRDICINYDPICHPAEVRAHRGPNQAEWLIEAHRPFAEVLASVVKKPVELHHNASLIKYLRMCWP